MQRRLIPALWVVLVIAGTGWASRSDNLPDESSILAAASISDTPHPSILLRANEVVYRPGEDIRVEVDIDPNGHSFPKTFFFYLQNMSTGEKRYFNDVAGFLPAGQIADVAGNSLDSLETFPIPNIRRLSLLGTDGVFGAALGATAGLIGNHQFCLELRDPSGRFVFFKTNFMFAIVDTVVLVTANITTDTTWTSNNAYLLDNVAIFVQDGATLTIEVGTYVLGQNLGALVVAQGGELVAAGTAAKPIVMTSAFSVGDRGPAQWGGLILNGRAPINTPGGVGQGEGFWRRRRQ